MNNVLIVVDVQRDFCEGGALAASNTLALMAPLQRFIARARQQGSLIVFTQDWHPPDHSSFKQNGGEWPVHCVANSRGAELMPPLAAKPEDLLVRKGRDRNAQGYSAFESTGLAETLRKQNIQSVAVCGIATEFCVRATALDAQAAGLQTAVLTDLIRPVEAGTTKAALREIRDRGIETVDSATWLTSR